MPANWKGTSMKDGKEIIAVQSCGVLILRSRGVKGREFLLMKHHHRYDLPKGHRQEGETEMEAALREMEEETGFSRDDVELNSTFRFEEVYYPKYKRYGGQTVEKKLVMFLGTMKEREAEKSVLPTEHVGYEWIPLSEEPISIQKKTIDPLLATVQKHLKEGVM